MGVRALEASGAASLAFHWFIIKNIMTDTDGHSGRRDAWDKVWGRDTEPPCPFYQPGTTTLSATPKFLKVSLNRISN